MAKAKPRLDWLTAACEAVNEDPAYRKLGSADFVLGLDIEGEARLVTFEAFEVTDVREIEPRELRDADIVISMSAKDWNAYLRQRAKGRGPSLLTLDLEQHVVRGADPLARLKLTQYSLSLQKFLDTGATLAA
jgi:hypothetical protein